MEWTIDLGKNTEQQQPTLVDFKLCNAILISSIKNTW